MKKMKTPKFKIFAIFFCLFLTFLWLYLFLTQASVENFLWMLLSLTMLMVLLWDYNASKKHINTPSSSQKIDIRSLGWIALIIGLGVIFYFDYRENTFIYALGVINIVTAIVVFTNNKK